VGWNRGINGPRLSASADGDASKIPAIRSHPVPAVKSAG